MHGEEQQVEVMFRLLFTPRHWKYLMMPEKCLTSWSDSMESQASIYDLLAKKTLTNIKTTDIHSAQSRTYADTASFDFWQGVMMLSKAVEVSRTFSSGNLPIYNTGAVVSAALAAGANITHTPSGTEIWQ